nr:MAG TPA: putative zinc-ribbon domain protein [Caudoviricetes sp.]
MRTYNAGLLFRFLKTRLAPFFGRRKIDCATNMIVFFHFNLPSLLQLDLRTLQFNHRDLEEKIRHYEQFDVEKDQYSLHQFATGAVVYRPKQPATKVDGDSFYYYLCANCYEQSKKSILQPAEIVNNHRTMKCHCCSSVILYEYIEWTGPISIGKRRRDWDGY